MSDEDYDAAFGAAPFSDGALAEIDAIELASSQPHPQQPSADGELAPEMEEAYELLRETFGLQEFRLKQREVVERLVVKNESAVAIFPTGGGKSLLYQLPALCFPHLTLVVSPLIALMKDQIDVLRKKGIAAASLDSSLSAAEASDVQRSIKSGKLKILYVAPERLNNERFVGMMADVRVSLLAVDESHCVSEWGHSFRPDYLKVARFAEECEAEHILCLTATATTKVADDIAARFGIPPEGIFRTPSYRPNLSLAVQSVPNDPHGATRKKLLVDSFKRIPGASIVYVTTQLDAMTVARHLSDAGLHARPYHAGLPHDERKSTQDWFMDPSTENPIVAATIAFGMGIDKNNIRNIIHYNLPKSIEGYSQEIGRAGRDRLPSRCLLLLSGSDTITLESFARGDTPSKEAVVSWLREVCSTENQSKKVGEAMHFSHYDQSTKYDIKTGTINMLFAHLELTYDLLRAITPFYETYSLRELMAGAVRSDSSTVAKALVSCFQPKALWTHVDVTQAAGIANVDRTMAAAKLQEWESKGWITLKAERVRHRYALRAKLPTDVTKMAEELYQTLEDKEQDEVERMHKVIQLATSSTCLAAGLSEHFGDVGQPACGQCCVCRTGGVGATIDLQTHPDVDKARWQALLAAVPDRDEPRLLCRVAFGISSPRITKARYSKSDVFGSMVDHDFGTLLKAAHAACVAGNWQPAAAPVPATKKRTASSAPAGAKAPAAKKASTSARGGTK